MKIQPLCYFALFLAMVGMFWHLSYKSDLALQGIYAHPRGAVTPASIESAIGEIKNSYELQLELVTLVHKMYILNKQTAVAALVFALPILFYALSNSKKKPSHSADLAPGSVTPAAEQPPPLP